MSQLVTFVTRRYSENDMDGTLIDHLYTNSITSIGDVNPHHRVSGSDHAGIGFKLNLSKPKQTFPSDTLLQYSKADLTGL